MMKNFIFPKVGTMPSRTLALLLQGKRITHKDFWLHVGSYCLRAPIFELRQKGWLILDLPEVARTSDPTKRKAHIKRYYLQQSEISLAGSDGTDYVRKVKDWERMRATGQAATNPADKTIGTIVQETDLSKVNTIYRENQPYSG